MHHALRTPEYSKEARRGRSDGRQLLEGMYGKEAVAAVEDFRGRVIGRTSRSGLETFIKSNRGKLNDIAKLWERYEVNMSGLRHSPRLGAKLQSFNGVLHHELSQSSPERYERVWKMLPKSVRDERYKP